MRQLVNIIQQPQRVHSISYNKQMPNRISSLRRRIDVIDQKLVSLLNQRAQIALSLSAHKQKIGLPIKDETREQTVISNALKNNAGPLDAKSLENIFKKVIIGCRRLQQSYSRKKHNAS